jgi:hypothetical protein
MILVLVLRIFCRGPSLVVEDGTLSLSGNTSLDWDFISQRLLQYQQLFTSNYVSPSYDAQRIPTSSCVPREPTFT